MTLIVDDVDYALPLGIIGRVAQEIFVRRALECVFKYRRRRIAELLDGQPG